MWFLLFDDEESSLDYVDNLFDVDSLEAIALELDEEEDGVVVEWFYDYNLLKWMKFVNGLSYCKW